MYENYPPLINSKVPRYIFVRKHKCTQNIWIQLVELFSYCSLLYKLGMVYFSSKIGKNLNLIEDLNV